MTRQTHLSGSNALFNAASSSSGSFSQPSSTIGFAPVARPCDDPSYCGGPRQHEAAYRSWMQVMRQNGISGPEQLQAIIFEAMPCDPHVQRCLIRDRNILLHLGMMPSDPFIIHGNDRAQTMGRHARGGGMGGGMHERMFDRIYETTDPRDRYSRGHPTFDDDFDDGFDDEGRHRASIGWEPTRRTRRNQQHF